MANQIPLMQDSSELWDPNAIHSSLDDLFLLARHYKSGKEYRELLQFISCFRSYSIFNALLVHVQMPGAKYVAPAFRWKRDYRRRIRLGARPLVILKPMGPVMFVFDVSDTEPERNAPPLPDEVTNPFAVKLGHVHNELQTTIDNIKWDGVKVVFQDVGSLAAGSIQSLEAGDHMQVQIRYDNKTEDRSIPVRYGLLLNEDHSRETQYVTLVHELAHLYCGHLGSPNKERWPDRRDLKREISELEAESVCYLVCQRLGIKNPSEKYLAAYVKDDDDVKRISIECIIKTAMFIEKMGKGRLPTRNEIIFGS